MKILITGSNGMLGGALRDIFLKDSFCAVMGIDISKAPSAASPKSLYISCDITDYEALVKVVMNVGADVIIHTAAFTDVDGCETNPGKAEATNGLGTRYVAQAALEANAHLIYISTDFVFDGKKLFPYKEDDEPAPLNVYGRSKLDGEKFAKNILKKSCTIIRSSWMFGRGGRNFVDTILKKAEVQKEIRVVSDQFGSPTYTVDLAKAIKRLIKLYEDKNDIGGIYHITNSDDCSWFKFAEKTLDLANVYGVELVPITSSELDRPAERPMTSILDNGRFIRLAKEPLRPWYEALEEYILFKKTL